jgi:hypothetical protein
MVRPISSGRCGCGAKFPAWVKLRKCSQEETFSALPSIADILGGRLAQGLVQAEGCVSFHMEHRLCLYVLSTEADDLGTRDCSSARRKPWNGSTRRRATIVQKKTGRPVQFEITEQSRSSVEAWLPILRATASRYLFPSRLHASPHISTRQYARLVHRWVEGIGLESAILARTRCGVRRRPPARDQSRILQPSRR